VTVHMNSDINSPNTRDRPSRALLGLSLIGFSSQPKRKDFPIYFPSFFTTVNNRVGVLYSRALGHQATLEERREKMKKSYFFNTSSVKRHHQHRRDPCFLVLIEGKNLEKVMCKGAL